MSLLQTKNKAEKESIQHLTPRNATTAHGRTVLASPPAASSPSARLNLLLTVLGAFPSSHCNFQGRLKT